jgi:hypothetical protein
VCFLLWPLGVSPDVCDMDMVLHHARAVGTSNLVSR